MTSNKDGAWEKERRRSGCPPPGTELCSLGTGMRVLTNGGRAKKRNLANLRSRHRRVLCVLHEGKNPVRRRFFLRKNGFRCADLLSVFRCLFGQHKNEPTAGRLLFAQTIAAQKPGQNEKEYSNLNLQNRS